MSMLSSDPILARSRGAASRALAYLSCPDDTDRQLVQGLYRWGKTAGVDAAIAVSQAFVETANLTSIRWIRDRNSANIGISSPATPQPFDIADGDAAARLHIQCLYTLVEQRLHPQVPLCPTAEEWIDDSWLERRILDPGFPPVRSIADLNQRYRDRTGEMAATWAWDDAYHTRLVAKGNAIFGHTLDGKELRVPTKSMQTTPVEVAITPAGNSNRSMLDMVSPSFITVHEVSGQDPECHEHRFRDLIHSGGGPDHVSYHFVVGPCRVLQLLPLDEVAWHAGDGYFGPGNRDSVAVAVMRGCNSDRSLSSLAWLVAEVITNPGRFFANQPRAWDFSAQRVRPHEHWAPGRADNGMTPGDWTSFMQRIDEAVERNSGLSARPQPMIPEFMTEEELARGIDRRFGESTAYALRRLWIAARDTLRLQHSGPDAPEIGPRIRQGESFIGEFVFKSYGQWWVLTRWGARVRMDDLEPQIELRVA
jgi:hypothetical protein